MIIDAHLHITNGFQGLTGAGRTESLELGMARQGDQIHQVLPPINPGKTVFPPETLIQFMNWVGIDKAVLLQGSFYGDQNQYLYETCQCWPDRFLPAAFLDPHASDVRDQFLQVTNEYGFRILKFEMSQPTGFTGVYPNLRLDGPEMSWIWEAAEQQELVVTLDLGKGRTPAYQTREVQTLIQRHPSLVVVIAHLAQPPLGKQGDRELNDLWEEQILLGQNANVWFDISALPAYQDEEYPFASALRYIRRAVDLIGADRLMWGSDIPGLLGHATYKQLLDSVCRHAGFSESELPGILGETAWKIYGPRERGTHGS